MLEPILYFGGTILATVAVAVLIFGQGPTVEPTRAAPVIYNMQKRYRRVE